MAFIFIYFLMFLAPRCFKWVKTRHRRKIWNSRTQEKERNRMAASNLKSLAPWKWG
jgi:hypothetical protein